MQSGGTVNNSTGTTANIVCTASTLCCYTVTIYVEVNSAHPDEEVEGIQEEFTEVVLTADGIGTISGQLLYYDESPIPGGSILDRMNTFIIIEGPVMP